MELGGEEERTKRSGLSNRQQAKGCLSIHGALACGTDGELVTQAMAKWRRSNENLIKERIQQAQREANWAET
jgi:hypothetical protein